MTNLHQPQIAAVQTLLVEATKFLQAGAVDRAFDTTVKAKSLRTPVINLDLIRSACFINMGRMHEALESLREELRHFPSNLDAQRLLDQLSSQMGHTQATDSLNDPDFSQLYEVIRPYTMLSVERLYSLFSQARRICLENVPGNFVECGVAAGGSSALLAYVIRRYSQSPRLLWCFDSFSGMPPAGEHDKHNGVPADLTGWGEGTCAAPRQSLEAICAKLGVSDIIRPVEGFFESTLPARRDWVGVISLLHMDGDWHSSTTAILDNLYDRIVDRGIIQVDDYGHWEGCKKACDDFFATRGLKPQISRIDSTGVWFEKPDCKPVNAALSPALIEGFKQHDVSRFGIESQMSENERFQLFSLLACELQHTPGQRDISFIEVGSYAGASLLQSYIALRSHGLPVSATAVEPVGQAQFYQVLRELGSDVRHLKMNSDVAASVLTADFKQQGRLADAIFIDGDHSYAGVKRDLELYFPLLRTGGLLIVHDYLPPLAPENREYILFHHGGSEPGIRQACDEFFATAPAAPVRLALLKPTDPSQTQAWLPVIPGVLSTVRAWRKL